MSGFLVSWIPGFLDLSPNDDGIQESRNPQHSCPDCESDSESDSDSCADLRKENEDLSKDLREANKMLDSMKEYIDVLTLDQQFPLCETIPTGRNYNLAKRKLASPDHDPTGLLSAYRTRTVSAENSAVGRGRAPLRPRVLLFFSPPRDASGISLTTSSPSRGGRRATSYEGEKKRSSIYATRRSSGRPPW